MRAASFDDRKINHTLAWYAENQRKLILQTQLTRAQVKQVNRVVMPPSDISDGDIIQRVQMGDSNAYGGLMRRYNQCLYRVARSIVQDNAAALDIVQEAYIKAYYKLSEFRGPDGFPTWLATITRNEALMYLRKHKREVRMDDEILSEPRIADKNLPDALVQNKQLSILMQQNIDQLPEGFRTVFVLRAVEHFSVKETSQILDIKEETVKTRYFRAKRLLRQYFQTYLDDTGMTLYEIGGHHCDIIVHNVLSHIQHSAQS